MNPSDLQKLAETLHPLERKVFPLLDRFSKLEDLVKESKLQEVEVLRALQWLQNKAILSVKEFPKEVAILDKNGLVSERLSGLLTEDVVKSKVQQLLEQ